MGIPLLELFLLTRVSAILGFGPTVLLVIVTGVVGSRLARSQGARVWTQIQKELASGRIPTKSGVDALLVLAAGLMLVTPGVLTDGVGLALLFPFVRNAIRPALVNWFKSRVKFGQMRSDTPRPPGAAGPSPTHPPESNESIDTGFDPFQARKSGPVVEADVVDPKVD